MLTARLALLFVAALSAADFAFNRDALTGKPAAAHKPKLGQNDIARVAHGFPSTQLRNFQLVQEGRFKSFKTTSGAITDRREEIVHIGAKEDSGTTEIILEIVVEEEPGVIETIIDNVRCAFDEYIAPLLGENVTSQTIAESARSALDWFSSQIWGFQDIARLAIVKVDRNTGDALIVKGPAVDVKVIRIDAVVFEASAAAVGMVAHEAASLSASMFRFEAGDLVVAAGVGFFEAVGTEGLVAALGHQHKTMAAKADALMKASPKSAAEQRFTLSVFE